MEMTQMKQLEDNAHAQLHATEVRGEELAQIEGGNNVIDGCIPLRPTTKGPYVPPNIRDLLQIVFPR